MPINSSVNSTALVIGGTGGLGSALIEALKVQGNYAQVLSLGRRTGDRGAPVFDYAQESTLFESASWIKAQSRLAPLTTVIIATGMLHSDSGSPEKSWGELNLDYLQHIMLVNAIGPALTLKHFASLMPKEGVVTWAMISAKVGSIGDNALGGWYGYRASKAALNQIVKTSSIEMTRRNKQSICVAIHPGTVDTNLSNPFRKVGLNVRSPEVAANELLGVLENLTPADTGCFVDYLGAKLPW
jgi:NAD(P)-dependent dehydrogenase (short-subunit alcohol dehydrogenase family)